ncbi:hypothetical protein [Paenibacillus sp. R14(2021)]|uniref:hypothetical protein n=1 Tax=Paenibacillus sp. R14(2021) TaxID=2859228 RepID=UPI001C615C4B|nr:hypothetical protein [Paenibacillus sp. R14(2021)]
MSAINSRSNSNWIPVFLIENDLPEREFKHLQECFRYLRGLDLFNGYSNKFIYNVINSGIDDDKKQYGFTFRTTVEAKAKRSDRKTR